MAQAIVGPAGPNPPPNSGPEGFLETARRRFSYSEDAESELRRSMLDDLRFRASDQWPRRVRQQREQARRTIITINRLPELIRQVTNHLRRARPGMKINPKGNGATREAAKILQALIRNIEYESNADVVYQTACTHQVELGRGWFRIAIEYESEYSFNKVIRLKRVRNSFTIRPDPTVQTLDYSDMRYCFVEEMIPRDEYRVRFPNSSMADWSGSKDSRSRLYSEWITEQSIRVAEYWYVDMVEDELVEYANDSFPHKIALLKSLATGELRDLIDPKKGWKVNRRRDVVRKEVRHALVNGSEILEGDGKNPMQGRLWPGTEIPIIPVIGEEIDLDGKVDVRGIIRDAKGPQKLYNWMVTSAAETVSLAPRAPYVLAAEQIKGHERMWKELNWMNHPYLLYNAVAREGVIVPSPIRNVQEPPIASIIAGIQQADADLKSTTGHHEPSIGERSHERSAKAIERLQERGERGSSHYMDNLAVSLRRAGQIIVDVIPDVMTEEQVVQLLSEDKRSQSNVLVGRGAQEREHLPAGVQEAFDPTIGMYGVTIDLGPSYQTKQEQILEQMSAFVSAYPETFKLIGDILARQMNHPEADKIADRLFSALPPHLQGEPPPDTPPEAFAHIQSLMQRVKQLAAEKTELQKQIDTKANEIDAKVVVEQIRAASTEQVALIKASLETESRERIAAVNNATKLALEDVKAAMGEATESLRAENQRAADERSAENQRVADQRKADGEEFKATMALIHDLFEDEHFTAELKERARDRAAQQDIEAMRGETQRELAREQRAGRESGGRPTGSGTGQPRS